MSRLASAIQIGLKCVYGGSLGAALATAMPLTAAAQLKPERYTGSLIPVRPENVEAKRAGIIKKNFAKCIYNRNRSAALTLIAHSDPISLDLKAANLGNLSSQFGMEKCLGDQASADQSELGLQLPAVVIKSMMEEESYLTANPVPPKLPEGATESVDRTFISEGVDLAKAHLIAKFDDCIVFKDAVKADALLRTTPNSDAERLAAIALAPTLGTCLTQGQTASLTPQRIRAFVDDGLWNRFVRPTLPQSKWN